jgi:hypothetical protein
MDKSSMVGSVSANDINALGVSPAKTYGHVAGTPARFFGAGIIKLPKLDDEYPFRVHIRKNQTGSYEFKARKGFVDGLEAVGAVKNNWTRITPQNQSVILECDVDKDLNITKANVKAGTIQEPFRVVIVSGKQTKARIIICQFDVDGSEVTPVQNIRTNLMAKLMCNHGYAAKFLVPETNSP